MTAVLYLIASLAYGWVTWISLRLKRGNRDGLTLHSLHLKIGSPAQRMQGVCFALPVSVTGWVYFPFPPQSLNRLTRTLHPWSIAGLLNGPAWRGNVVTLDIVAFRPGIGIHPFHSWNCPAGYKIKLACSWQQAERHCMQAGPKIRAIAGGVSRLLAVQSRTLWRLRNATPAMLLTSAWCQLRSTRLTGFALPTVGLTSGSQKVILTVSCAQSKRSIFFTQD